MDANVTRGNLKNLVTDKPAPITVALAQKSDTDGLFKLMDANVTRGALKNLVTDKPAPITVALAQTNGIPVFVNPESILEPNTEAASSLSLTNMIIGPDEVNALQLQHKQFLQASIEPLGSENQPGNLVVKDRNPSVELAQIEPLASENKPGNLAIVDRNPSVLLAQTQTAPVDGTTTEETNPGDFKVTDHDAVDSTIVQLNV